MNRTHTPIISLLIASVTYWALPALTSAQNLFVVDHDGQPAVVIKVDRGKLMVRAQGEDGLVETSSNRYA